MARKPFGGYTISFAKVKDMTLGEAFGTGAITPSEMTKRIWKVIKSKGLAHH